MDFSLTEKLAIIKALEEVLLADGQIKDGELLYLQHLTAKLRLDDELFHEARRMSAEAAIMTLRQMSGVKKQELAGMLGKIALADGKIDEEEIKVIFAIFLAAGINIEPQGSPEDKQEENEKKLPIDLSNVYFVSSDHIRYENGEWVSGPHGGARRAIKTEPNTEGKKGYTVTIFNLEGIHPAWGNNVQMSPKQMEVVHADDEKVVLRGWGDDPMAMGDPAGRFSNYGISIFHKNKEIQKIILHLQDRNVDIEYLK